MDRVIRGVEAKDVDDELSGNAGKTDEAPQPAVPTDTGSMWLPRPYLVIPALVPARFRHDRVPESTISNHSSPVNQETGCARCAKLALNGVMIEIASRHRWRMRKGR